MGRFFSHWLPVLMWAGVIFVLSSIPDLKSEFPSSWDLVLRKLAHMTEFAILALLLLRAFRNSGELMVQDWAFVFLIVMLYAVSDEIHQSGVGGRHGSFWDVLIDMAGGILGMIVYHLGRRMHQSSRDV